MLDLIKEGLKSSEDLAVLPFKAIQEFAGDSNKTLAEIAGLSQDIVSIPFQLANQGLEFLAVGEEDNIGSENKQDDK